jgi:hypothetical protein
MQARIVGVADVFDALTHERPYKSAWPVDMAVDEITKNRGSQFDPLVVDAFSLCDPEELVDPREPVPSAATLGDRTGFDRLARLPAPRLDAEPTPPTDRDAASRRPGARIA